MIHKNIITIGASILLLSFFIFTSIPNSYAADPPLHSVKGILYTQNGIAPEGLIINFIFPTGLESCSTYIYNITGDKTNFNKGFDGHDNEQAEIKIIYGGFEFTPADNTTITIFEGQIGYVMDILIYATNFPPYVPSNPSPNNNAADLEPSSSFVISWNGGDQDVGDILKYKLHWGTTSNPPLMATISNYPYNYTPISYTIQNSIIQYDTNYYWKVISEDSYGYTSESPVWQFKTKSSSNGGQGTGGTGGTPTNQSGEDEDGLLIADAGGPYNGVINKDIILDGSGSTDTNGTIVGYRWDFDGDGSYDTSYLNSAITIHSYSNIGTYNIILEVKDSKDNTDIDTAVATISLTHNPTAPIITGPNEGSINTIYTFSAISTDEDDDNIRYRFNWGDGSELIITDFTTENTIVDRSHNFSEPGLFVIKVQAEDTNSGSSDWSEKLFFVDVTYSEINKDISGFLIDQDDDGIYDEFFNNDTGAKSNVEIQTDGVYFIDSNADGEWDYIYNPLTGALEAYVEETSQEQSENNDNNKANNDIIWYILGFFAVIVVILVFLFGARRKNK